MANTPLLTNAAFAAALLALTLAPAPSIAAGGSDYASPAQETGPMADAKRAIASENFASALQYLEAARLDDPNSADVYNLIGFSSRNLGDYDAAGAAYEQALSLDPKHKGALEYQGELFLTLNQLDQAKANLARLEEICWVGCSEERELSEAIAAYEATN